MCRMVIYYLPFMFSFHSLFFGNLYIYCAWHGHVHITGMNLAVSCLHCTCVCLLLFLKVTSCIDISQKVILSMWLMLFVPDKDRQTVFISLTVISLVGCFLFFLIRKPDPESPPSEVTESLLPGESIESSSARWVCSVKCGPLSLHDDF